MAVVQQRRQAVHQRRPGTILIGAQREFCRAWPNQTRGHRSPATISSRKTAPAEIGQAIADWLAALG